METHTEISDVAYGSYWSFINVAIHRVASIIIIPRQDEPPVQQISFLDAEGSCIFQVTAFGKDIVIKDKGKENG